MKKIKQFFNCHYAIEPAGKEDKFCITRTSVFEKKYLDASDNKFWPVKFLNSIFSRSVADEKFKVYEDYTNPNASLHGIFNGLISVAELEFGFVGKCVMNFICMMIISLAAFATAFLCLALVVIAAVGLMSWPEIMLIPLVYFTHRFWTSEHWNSDKGDKE